MVKALNYGRCGNALYQNANAIAYALKNGLEFTVPDTTTSEKWNPLYLQHLVNPEWDSSLPYITIKEKYHQYKELPFDESWREKNIILDGYWQSWKYFEGYREQILELFGFKWQIKKGYVSVHVRRGDYIELREKHPDVPKEWVLKAMSLFPGYTFKFFSDDIRHCIETYSYLPNVEFSENNNEIDDLVEASCCEHQICSASTFSVWVHWLNRNPNKQGIFPEKWFVDGYCNLVTDDIIEPHCLKLRMDMTHEQIKMHNSIHWRFSGQQINIKDIIG